MTTAGWTGAHIERGAGTTIGAVRIPAADASRFGIFETDAEGRVLAFEEKPAKGKEIPAAPEEEPIVVCPGGEAVDEGEESPGEDHGQYRARPGPLALGNP